MYNIICRGNNNVSQRKSNSQICIITIDLGKLIEMIMHYIKCQSEYLIRCFTLPPSPVVVVIKINSLIIPVFKFIMMYGT